MLLTGDLLICIWETLPIVVRLEVSPVLSRLFSLVRSLAIFPSMFSDSGRMGIKKSNLSSDRELHYFDIDGMRPTAFVFVFVASRAAVTSPTDNWPTWVKFENPMSQVHVALNRA